MGESSEPLAKRAKIELKERERASKVVAYPSVTYVVRSLSGAVLTASDYDVRSPVSALRGKVAVAIGRAPFSFHLSFNQVALWDDDTLEAKGVDESAVQPLNIVMVQLQNSTT